jgi:predicted RNase H-like HicB family nuclease
VSGTIFVRDTGEGFLASVAEVPGCVARGASRDEAAANARRALPEYLALLEKYGVSTEHWKDLDPAAFAVKDSTSTDWFADDLRPMQEHEVRDFLHQMEGSRAALLALIRGLSSDDLEKRPTPDTWSVRGTLEHVMSTEAALVGKLEKWPDNVGALQAVHRMAFQRFSILEPADTAIDHRIAGVRWSTRRVMRRILEHEYEHMEQIREILAELGSQRAPE